MNHIFLPLDIMVFNGLLTQRKGCPQSIKAAKTIDLFSPLSTWDENVTICIYLFYFKFIDRSINQFYSP